MGRIFTVELEEDYGSDYFMCKTCRTHIALAEDLNSVDPEPELFGTIFIKAVNVRVDEPVHHKQVDGHIVSDIYCVKCGDKLGWKYIQVDREQMHLQNENVKLDLEKLLRMYGNKILDAETMDPVGEDNQILDPEAMDPVPEDNQNPEAMDPVPVPEDNQNPEAMDPVAEDNQIPDPEGMDPAPENP